MVALGFTNTKTGANFTLPVSNGKFSINLPNGAVYDVAAKWAGNYSWQTGVDDRGVLTVNMSNGSMGAMSYDLQLEAPPTIVAAKGTILWTLPRRTRSASFTRPPMASRSRQQCRMSRSPQGFPT